MNGLRKWWLKKRDRLSLGLFVEMVTGKFLIGLGLGAFFAESLNAWAWWLIGIGVLIDGLAKWRWLKK